MTSPVGRVPLTDEELEEYERIVKRDGLYGDESLRWFGDYGDALIAELRASRAREAELAAELSVLRPALRAAKRRIGKALAVCAEYETLQQGISLLNREVRAALTGTEDTEDANERPAGDGEE